MSGKISDKLKKYFELKAQVEELKKQMEEVREEILTDVDELGVESLEVELEKDFKVKVSKVKYKYEEINKKVLAEKYPEIYNEIRSEKDVFRLDIRKLKNEDLKLRGIVNRLIENEKVVGSLIKYADIQEDKENVYIRLKSKPQEEFLNNQIDLLKEYFIGRNIYILTSP